MIQDTSTKAFKQDALPTLGERHAAVIAALEKLGEATNTELATHLGWSINRVTPRVHELRGLSKVVEKGKRSCKITGRTAYVWQLAPGQQRLPI